jgi:regulator of RNase E activity RraA
MPQYDVAPLPPPLPPDILEVLATAETATIGHWRLHGFVDPGIRPLKGGWRVLGSALTVAIPAMDSVLLHHAVSIARPGDVVVIDRLGDRTYACLGGGVALAAKTRGAAGAILDGPCTDPHEIREMDFPVWCRGVSPVTTRQQDIGGRLNFPVSIGGAVVMPGDVVLADESGVVILGRDEAIAVGRMAAEREARGAKSQARMRAGEPIGAISGATAKVEAALAAARGQG